MGITTATIHKKIYRLRRRKGMDHQQVIDSIPKDIREGFKRNIIKSSFEAYFGNPMKELKTIWNNLTRITE